MKNRMQMALILELEHIQEVHLHAGNNKEMLVDSMAIQEGE